MDICNVRPAHRNGGRPQALCEIQEADFERWFHHVPVQPVHPALHEPRECRCAYPQGEKDSA